METDGIRREEGWIPETLEEAYVLRDAAPAFQEREYYQGQVYRLRAQDYFSRGIWTEDLLRRRRRRGLGALRKEDEAAHRTWWKRLLGLK